MKQELKIGVAQAAILTSVAKSPKSTSGIAKDLWGDIYKISDRKAKDRMLTYISNSISRMAKYYFLVKLNSKWHITIPTGRSVVTSISTREKSLSSLR